MSSTYLQGQTGGLNAAWPQGREIVVCVEISSEK